jgi:hypothetical protein
MPSPLKDPKGGLTQAGRDYFRRKEGARLKPGVKGPANTPEKMRRKGSFLRRFYGRKQIPPLKTASGKPTRYALAAHAWGEKVPTSMSDVRRLAAKGTTLLKRYQATRKDNPMSFLKNPVEYLHNPVISKPMFSPGHVVATPGVMQKVTEPDLRVALMRHVTGEWGDMDEEDRAQNLQAARTRSQVLSVHKSSLGVTFWVITDPGHEVTTFLLPEEY